jgi:hypothetical protein
LSEAGGGSMDSTLAEISSAGLESPIPSKRLEHDAQMLGFLDNVFPPSDIGSQQQMQIMGFNFNQHQLISTAFQEKFIHIISNGCE